MFPTEVWLWCLTALLTLLGTISAVVWSMLREEHKSHSEAIKSKADQLRLTEAEARFDREVSRMRDENNILISKIEQRHERDLDNMENRLCTKMESLETNLLRQMELIMELLRKNNA